MGVEKEEQNFQFLLCIVLCLNNKKKNSHIPFLNIHGMGLGVTWALDTREPEM